MQETDFWQYLLKGSERNERVLETNILHFRVAFAPKGSITDRLRKFFKSVFSVEGRFEWIPFVCGVTVVVLVLFFPVFFDCLDFLHKGGKNVWSFLLRYVNNYTCHIWLANCYVVVAPDLCEFRKICILTKDYERLETSESTTRNAERVRAFVKKTVATMLALMFFQVVVALSVGGWTVYHQTNFNRVCVAVAYGSYFGVLIELLGCKLTKNYVIHRIKHPIKDTNGGLNEN